MKLKADGKTINVSGGHLVPCATDWKGDGRKDLVLGQFSGGRISAFLNRGTDAAPELGPGTELQAGGKPIRLEAG